jgi:hypothetical protein
MRLDEYQQLPIQDGDLVFGYRESLDQPAVLFTGVADSGGNSEYTKTVTVQRADILALNTTPYILITPPEGYGVQLTAPPAMIVNDRGTPFNFSSGETVDLFNNSMSSNTICQFGFSAVVSSPLSTAIVISYDIPVDSPVSVSATSPITGGGSGATFKFIIKYRLLAVS